LSSAEQASVMQRRPFLLKPDFRVLQPATNTSSACKSTLATRGPVPA
jgi:hypothetical protein